MLSAQYFMEDPREAKRLGRKVETLIGAQVGGSGVAFDRQEHSLGISAAGVGLPILSAARSLSPSPRS